MDPNPKDGLSRGFDLGSCDPPPIETLAGNELGTDDFDLFGEDFGDGSRAEESRVFDLEGKDAAFDGDSSVGAEGVDKGGSFTELDVGLGEMEGGENGGGSESESGRPARHGFSIRENKVGFCEGDLAWGKVKSHPWWPGQIFDPLYASEMAMKIQKKDHLLVSYFGDKTFAWVPESHLKPFQECFSEMEKQSSMESFVNAVGSSLDEVSRRVELGLSCNCLQDDISANLKFRKIENAGIREGLCCSSVDKSVYVNAFQPEAVLGYMQELAQCPHREFDRLELTLATAQLKAFYRLKGYRELPVFVYGVGLIGNDAEIQLAKGEIFGIGEPDSLKPVPSVESGKKRRGRPPKNRVLEGNSEQTSLSKKKEEIASQSTSSVRVTSSVNSGSGKKRGRPRKVPVAEDSHEQKILLKQKEGRGHRSTNSVGPPSIESGKRRRYRPRKFDIYADDSDQQTSSDYMEEEDEDSSDSEDNSRRSKVRSVSRASRKRRKIHREVDSDSDAPSPRVRSSKIGDQNKQVASELKESRTRKTSVATRNRWKGADHTSSVAKKIEIAPEDYPPPTELWSQICLVATAPVDEYSFLPVIKGFFTAFRDSVSSISSEDQEFTKSIGRKRGRKKKVVNSESEPTFPKTSDAAYMKDSYWSDIKIHSSPEREAGTKGQQLKGTSHRVQKKSKLVEEPELVDPSVNDVHHLLMGNDNPNDKEELKGERGTISSSMETTKEESPTALVLSFNSSDGVPSASDLIKIFSPYGPLREEETEVILKTKCAKVTFRYPADAEKAYSSAGKYSVFGPALVSYELRYSSPKSYQEE